MFVCLDAVEFYYDAKAVFCVIPSCKHERKKGGIAALYCPVIINESTLYFPP